MKRRLIIFGTALTLAIGGFVYATNHSDASKNCPMTPDCSTPQQCQQKMASGNYATNLSDASKNCPMTPDCSTPQQCQQKMASCTNSPDCCKPKH